MAEELSLNNTTTTTTIITNDIAKKRDSSNSILFHYYFYNYFYYLYHQNDTTRVRKQQRRRGGEMFDYYCATPMDGDIPLPEYQEVLQDSATLSIMKGDGVVDGKVCFFSSRCFLCFHFLFSQRNTDLFFYRLYEWGEPFFFVGNYNRENFSVWFFLCSPLVCPIPFFYCVSNLRIFSSNEKRRMWNGEDAYNTIQLLLVVLFMFLP